MEAKLRCVRSDGETFTFGDERIGILEFTGIGKVSPEIFTKKRAVGHGSIVTGMRMPEREFGVKAALYSAKDNDAVETEMGHFFNPVYTFDVEVTVRGHSRKAVGCYIRSLDVGAGNYYAPLKPAISFLCEEPFFLSLDSFGKDIAASSGGLHFPLATVKANRAEGIKKKTIVFGVYQYGNGAVLENDGDTDAYISARIESRGDIQNPCLNVGSSFIKILGDFRPGDVILIDSSQKRVTLNGENITNRIDRNSRWNAMIAGRGATTVSINADSGSNQMSCYVYFYKRYLGVV